MLVPNQHSPHVKVPKLPHLGFHSFCRYTVLFIHDGSSWRDVRVLEAAVRELDGVTSLSAAADLDIGEFSLK